MKGKVQRGASSAALSWIWNWRGLWLLIRQFAPDQIVGNHRALHVGPQINLAVCSLETRIRAPARCRLPPARRCAPRRACPRCTKGAIRKSGGAPARDFGDLIARPPKGAIGKSAPRPCWPAPTRTIVGSGPWKETNSPLLINRPKAAQFSTTNEVKQSSAPMPRKFPLQTPAGVRMNL